MPQLDQVTFFSQFFWLCFFFLGFYFALVQFFLPKMARLFKLRQKKMEEIKNQAAFYLSETKGQQQKRWENYAQSLDLQKTLANEPVYLQKEGAEETWENGFSQTLNPTLNQAYTHEKEFLENHMIGQNLAFIYFSTLPTDKAPETLALPSAFFVGYELSNLLSEEN